MPLKLTTIVMVSLNQLTHLTSSHRNAGESLFPRPQQADLNKAHDQDN